MVRRRRRFEVTDASVGEVGALLQLRWRLRLRGARLGDVAMVVEQHAYAATGATGRIERMSLLCSGFWKEHYRTELQPAADQPPLTNSRTTKGPHT
jgi:hypothetical protein